MIYYLSLFLLTGLCCYFQIHTTILDSFSCQVNTIFAASSKPSTLQSHQLHTLYQILCHLFHTKLFGTITHIDHMAPTTI
uniref:Secreted protein n=1 Tax=Octopus bimaculoides TaxID=37653 RepID=A0A0L8HTW0_OCTBM